MSDACKNCNRADCPMLTAPDLTLSESLELAQIVERLAADLSAKVPRLSERQRAYGRAKIDCESHAVNWRQRALAAEARLAELEHIMHTKRRNPDPE